MTGKPLEIRCAACDADAWLRREPVYEGLKKTGERLLCSACGHEYASESEVPFKAGSRPRIFTDADRLKKVDIFHSDEVGRNCRHCRHYVVNPFVQRCGLRQREVQATDLCADFNPPEPEPELQPPEPPAKKRRLPGDD